MDQSLVVGLLGAAALAAGGISLVLYRARGRRRKTRMNDLSVLFDDRHMSIHSLNAFPNDALSLPPNSPEISRLRHLALDGGKAVLFHPGKTLEVVFKPEIQKGLQDGAYALMKTKQGEVLADAVDVANGQVVGKGRLVEAGKVKQLAAAGFQLLSIAVAQAHLAEIAEGMRAINLKLDSIVNRLEANDVAEIRGAISYLKGIAEFVHGPGNGRAVSSEKAHQIESIIADSHSWLHKLEGHLEDLLEQASSLKDLDTFGTGKTFDSFQYLMSRLKELSERRALYVTFTNTTALVTSYLDPKGVRFSKASASSATWDKLMNSFSVVLQEKASEHFKDGVLFNKGSTLTSRREYVHQEAKYMVDEAGELRSQAARLAAAQYTREGLLTADRPVRLALTFDAQGEVIEAGVLAAV